VDGELTAGDGPKALPSLFSWALRNNTQRLKWAVCVRCVPPAMLAEASRQGWPEETDGGRGHEWVNLRQGPAPAGGRAHLARTGLLVIPVGVKCRGGERPSGASSA
jgi:hypothetical protein